MLLSKNELIVLQNLTEKEETINEIAKKTKLNEDAVRRAVETLKNQDLIDYRFEEKEKYVLGAFGKKYLNEEFPEEKLIKALNKPKSVAELQKELGKEAGLAIGLAKKQNIIEMKDGKVFLKENKKEIFEKIREELNKLHKGENANLDLLKTIPKLIERETKKEIFVKANKNTKTLSKEIKVEVNELTHEMLIEKKWKEVQFKKYNVEAETEPKYGAKFQPYKRFLDLIRKKLIALGFEEIDTSLTTTEFYNFDVLFQPQNHPARTWTDTYSLKTPSKGKLPSKEIVEKVKSAHENGGLSGSKGWQYKWNPEIAMKMMPAAHGTAFSAKKMVEGIKVPARYFALARVYRPDVLDATHLNEFNQLEGFVVAKEASFKHLLGLLANFAKEIAGAEEILFYPDYYPFTEPSVQLSAKHPKLGWVEFGGAGIFRPEITKNLGIKERVIAWGLGIDRLAMFNLGIHDIRDLFSNKLDWLRKKPIVEKI